MHTYIKQKWNIYLFSSLFEIKYKFESRLENSLYRQNNLSCLSKIKPILFQEHKWDLGYFL